jgi:hypothetical protein
MMTAHIFSGLPMLRCRILRYWQTEAIHGGFLASGVNQ